MSQKLGCIRLTEIECWARIGVSPEERAHPQRLLINLDLSLDLEPAGRTDCLDLTLDYAQVVETLRDQASQGEFHLLEALARQLMQLLMGIPRVEAVALEIEKFPADLTGQLKKVAVRLDHSR